MSIVAERPGATSSRMTRDRRGTLEEALDRRAILGADPRQQPERPAEPPPMPGHVEDAAAGQDVAARDVVIEADRAHEQCPGGPLRGRRLVTPPVQRIGAGRATRDEAVVANLDDLAHLPERLDREVAAAFEVVPLLPAGECRDQVGIVDRHDGGAEHEPR